MDANEFTSIDISVGLTKAGSNRQYSVNPSNKTSNVTVIFMNC